MPPERSAFRSIVSLTAVASAPLAFGCLLLLVLAAGLDPAVLADPLGTLRVGAAGAPLVGASMILDMLGYYLLLIPSIVWLRRTLGGRHRDLSDLLAVCGLAYVLVGAIGAGALAAAAPPMIRAYEVAAGAEREALASAFGVVSGVVVDGLWNTLEVLLGGAWWLGTGALLRRDRPALGVVTMVLGASATLDGIATIAGAHELAGVPLAVYLVLAPIWAGWLGISVARGLGADDASERAVGPHCAGAPRGSPRISLSA